MLKDKFKIIRTFLLILPFFVFDGFAEYTEGIDTTDENGYGLDSAFRISGGYTGKELTQYFYDNTSTAGRFNYTFEEINNARDTAMYLWVPTIYTDLINIKYCFVVKDKKDRYMKVRIISRYFDSYYRYIYIYGLQTIPDERKLIKSDYDHTFKFKPNNLYYRGERYSPFHTFIWEPPLSNNNHLKGYIVYFQKSNTVIDTNAPINISQWDSVGFTDSTRLDVNISPIKSNGEFFNIVAVYEEGRSDFLKGWTTLSLASLEASQSQKNAVSRQGISISRTRSGYVVRNNFTGGTELSLFTSAGKQIAKYSNRQFFIDGRTITTGLYLLRAEFPDRTVLTQPFIFTK